MKKKIGIALLAALALTGQPAVAASTSELLQQGLYAEEVDGNVENAIKIYGQIINNRSARPNQVAQALYRQGLCYLKLKDEASARASLEKLVAEYSSETAIVEKARPVLEDLTNFDPAALMPAGTLVYVEFGSPGRQIETVVDLLKGTPYENPLTIAGGGNQIGHGDKSPQAIVSALLNPSMLAEFKKIRSSAIGITGIAQNNPPFVAVLYPGKSDALRGLIVAALGMAGNSGDPLEGMQTVTIPKAAAIAYDDKVVIVAQSVGQLEWCVKQYKGKISEPTLASSNKSFAKLNKVQRQRNALTIWATVDDAYTRLLSLLPPGQIPREIQSANAVVDFANIDEFVFTHSLEPGGVASRAEIQFKDGHHCLAYDLIRTPNIRKTALEAVPEQAIALASFALASADSAQAEKVRAKVQNVTGLDLGRELFANIEQVTVFVLPLPGEQTGPGKPEALAGQLGVAITSRNPDQTRQLFATLLGTVSTMSGAKENGTPGRYRVGSNGKQDIYCYTEQVNGVTLLALNREVIDAATTALKTHKSVCAAGPLNDGLNKVGPATSKLLLVNAGGAMRLIGPQVNLSGLKPEQVDQFKTSFGELSRALDSTTVQLRSDEQLNSIEVNSAVSGIPPLSKILGPVTQLSRLNRDARDAASSQWARQQKAATVFPAPRPPAIDGNVDALWNDCTAYKLANVVYDRPASPDDLSGEFKTMWDAENLYILVDVTDDQLRHDTPREEWFQSDGVELYIDAANNKAAEYDGTDYQYAFNWDKTEPSFNELKHSRTNGVHYAFATTAKGYRVEIQFPWSTLGTKPAAGSRIGLEVQVNDNDGGNRRSSKITWHDPKDEAWTNPRAFGNAELGGLVGRWTFDETEGTTARDDSGNHHDGTLVGNPRWTKGKIAGAIRLDGAGSFVRIAGKSAFDISGEITLASWINIHSVPSGWMAIVTKGDTAWRLSTMDRERKIHFSCNDYTQKALANSVAEMSPDQWHHVAAVYDGAAMRLYVDGKLDATEPWNGAISHNDSDVLIGENAEKTGRCFDGMIDDLRVYNYALGDEQIKALATGP